MSKKSSKTLLSNRSIEVSHVPCLSSPNKVEKYQNGKKFLAKEFFYLNVFLHDQVEKRPDHANLTHQT